MPREVVHCDGPYHVKVGWADGRDVQIGVEGDEGRSLTWLLYGDEHSRERIGTEVFDVVKRLEGSASGAELGAAVLNILDCVPRMPDTDEMAAGETTSYGYRGVWADLSRHGCNRLIKLLRRARDSAYGRDE